MRAGGDRACRGSGGLGRARCSRIRHASLAHRIKAKRHLSLRTRLLEVYCRSVRATRRLIASPSQKKYGDPMQRFFSMIIIFAILVVGGGYLYTQKSGEEAKQEIMDKRAEARRTFADKARAAAREEDNGTYERAIQAAIKSYDEELKKRVYAKRDEMRDPAAFEKEVDKQFKEGLIKEVQHKSMLEGYKMVSESYDTLMAANWRPVLTAKGMGETRLDIYDMHRTRDDEGNPILEGKFFFWGIEDTTHMTWGQLSMRYWGKVVKPVKEGRKTVEKEVEEVLGKAEGDAQPAIFVQNP